MSCERSFFFFWGGNLERKILSFAQILLGLLFIHEPYEHSERQQFAVGVHLCLPFFGISCCCHSALTAMPLSFGLIVRWHLFSSFVSCVSCPCMFRLCPFICLAALLAEVVLDLWPFCAFCFAFFVLQFTFASRSGWCQCFGVFWLSSYRFASL